MNSAPHATNRFLTGLLGAPIAHSASPDMHERVPRRSACIVMIS